MTSVNLNQCIVVLLTNEQVEMLCEAIRDRRAATTTTEPVQCPGIVKAFPANMRQLPKKAVG